MESILTLFIRFELFNNLFPGIIFMYFLKLYNYLLFSKDAQIYEVLFISYFLGLVFNRIGSLILEPFFSKIKIFEFLKIFDYPFFLVGRKKDDKLNISILINNMYRSFIVVFILCFIFILTKKNLSMYFKEIIIILFLIFIFIYSYIKQTYFIKRKLINFENEKKNGIDSKILISSATYIYRNSTEIKGKN